MVHPVGSVMRNRFFIVRLKMVFIVVVAAVSVSHALPGVSRAQANCSRVIGSASQALHVTVRVVSLKRWRQSEKTAAFNRDLKRPVNRGLCATISNMCPRTQPWGNCESGDCRNGFRCDGVCEPDSSLFSRPMSPVIRTRTFNSLRSRGLPGEQLRKLQRQLATFSGK